MPRTADPELPHRILKAADALWQSGGEEAVTIRGVAAEAATTTPTVYSYYADREALLTALRALAFQRFSAYLAKIARLPGHLRTTSRVRHQPPPRL